ncbi:MAG TPA: acyltransferase [Acidimicrobiia bacterium]
MADVYVHDSATVEDGASIGSGTRIWHYSHVRTGSRIGRDCIIGFSVFVDSGVVIGDRCKVQNLVSLYRGVTLEDEVLVGPSVAFTNDLFPRAQPDSWEVVPTLVRSGASLGANSTVLCGVTVGEWAMVAAGAVVTKSVAPHALVLGAPARHSGWVCACGRILSRATEAPTMPCTCGRSIGT